MDRHKRDIGATKLQAEEVAGYFLIQMKQRTNRRKNKTSPANQQPRHIWGIEFGSAMDSVCLMDHMRTMLPELNLTKP